MLHFPLNVLQTELAQVTDPLDFRKNIQISETVQQGLVMSAKCSAVWVLGLVSVRTIALV